MTSRFTRAFPPKLLSKGFRPGFHTRLIGARLTADSELNTLRRRTLHTALWPPLVFGELLLALWAYKVDTLSCGLILLQCLMLIIFQNKLIYLPYIPVGARKETIQEYRTQLLGFDWTTSEVRTPDGKSLSTCVAKIRLVICMPQLNSQAKRGSSRDRSRILSGVQLPYSFLIPSNASSMPSRLPFLSRILKTLSESEKLKNVNLTIVAPSYRGYLIAFKLVGLTEVIGHLLVDLHKRAWSGTQSRYSIGFLRGMQVGK